MDNWLPSLQTSNPQEGFELAIKLSRMAVKYTQPDMQKRAEGRKQYDENAKFLIQASAVVASNFRTVALANKFWNADS